MKAIPVSNFTWCQTQTVKPKNQNEPVQLPIATRNGIFMARYSEQGLTSLNFPAHGRANLRAGLGARQTVPAIIRRWHRATTSALKRALAGRAPQALPPLDFSGGTVFQRRVWSAMRRIACGQTRSYGEIARVIGQPKAVRAVGGACGANPIPVLVPCHRVLAANGKIGGFSGGLNWKRRLLEREGVNWS